MSSSLQNARSPDQQFDEIKLRLKRLGLKWDIVKIYRDEAKSGRQLRTRKAYQQMLHDVKSGAVKADLILVDTAERFGRVQTLTTIRTDLEEQHGVLVLTADSDFTDPQTESGRALMLLETLRATSDGYVKAHTVYRGKRDAAQLGHWPGSKAPFGLQIESVLKTVNGRTEVDYSRLVPDPLTAWIIRRLFDLAERTSHAGLRLAQALSNDPEIPSKYKPFHHESVSRWLDNTIYFGEISWGIYYTGIAADTIVKRKNKPVDVIRVPNFCQAIVPKEQWDAVQAIRQIRRDRHAAKCAKKPGRQQKLFHAVAPGLTVKHILSGLLRCGSCRRRMTASSTSEYVMKTSGERKRYTHYVCPGYVGRICNNGTRIEESWISEVVVKKLLGRLLSE